MLRKSARHIAIILSIGLLCVAGTTDIHAQTEQTRQVTLVQDMAPVGLVVGQTLRYTWANLNDPDPLERDFEPLRIGVRLLAADGSVIAEDGAAAVGAGRFQVFEFKRDAITRSGEADLGRLQVRLEVTVVVRRKFPDIVLKRGLLETFDDVVEIIDDSSGRTTVSFGGGWNQVIMDDTPGKESPAPRASQIVAAGNDHLIGIVPGQVLRLSAVNPLAPGQDGRKYKMLFAVVMLDADGEVIAQSDEIVLDPGKSHSFDFERAALPRIGEVGTYRLQVRAEIRRFFPGIISRLPQGGRDAAPVALEIVDRTTGKTMLLGSSKPKEIVVISSK